MKIWNSFAGRLEIELTSADPEDALNEISATGIEIKKLESSGDLSCRFQINRQSYSKLEELCKKRGETLRIIRRIGLYWSACAVLFRPVILVGLIFFFLLVLILPTRILFVEVDGNQDIPANRILSAAEKCGISFGASRREVRSEKVKNALLSEVPELQWAGVNTFGCVAKISVRERSDKEKDIEIPVVTNIVAQRDGYILSATVIQGNATFQVGQTVREGQVLISGYTDCGISIQATRSKGEVYALTNRKLEAVCLSNCLQRGTQSNVKQNISILYRKKRINLWKGSGISDSSCGRIYKEYYITLPGGFTLPIALCVEIYSEYFTQPVKMTQEHAKVSLAAFTEQYLSGQMIAGEIRSKNQKISVGEGIYRLTGKYTCVEMIGREQQEQIGDTNGKNS